MVKLDKIYFVFGFFLISALIIIGCSAQPTGNVASSPKCKNVQVPYEYQEEYAKTEYYTESVPYTDKECESKYLTYKVTRGDCENRQSHMFSSDEPARFSCTITDLDNEGGQFSMRIGFNVNGQQLDETQNRYIYPQSSETFRIERDAAIQSCFCIEQVPTKQVCRDVIKYQEVQRERQVTAYRPITKYRTEQKCE